MLEELRENPVVRAYRGFYWRIGIDPTKIRPASEALVRKALQGSFPRVNFIVDAGSIASAYTMIPIGIYDLDSMRPPLRLIIVSKRGKVLSLKFFKPIGGGEVGLEKGLPILVDSRGIVVHVYPHRDSVETMVRDSTMRILIVAGGVPRVNSTLVKKAVELVAKNIRILEKVGWKWCKTVRLV